MKTRNDDSKSAAIVVAPFFSSMHWWLVFAAICYALYFVYQRGADLNWDLLNYHFYMGYALLNGRLYEDIAAANLQTFLNPAWNVLAYGANRFLAFPWNAWSLTAIQLFALPILMLIILSVDERSEPNRSVVPRALAFSISLVSPLWWSELGTSFFSSSTTPLVLLGLLFVIRDLSGKPGLAASKRFLVAGGLMGLATGLKLTNALFLLALPFALVPSQLGGARRQAIRLCGYYAVGSALGFGLTAWWNVYLWAEWGSPLYPFYNKLFQSPYFDLNNWRDLRWKFGSPREFVEFLFQAGLGTSKTSEVRFSDARVPILAFLSCTYLLSRILGPRFAQAHAHAEQREVAAAGVLWFFFVAFLLWAFLFAYQRYLIPLELIAGVVVWILARRLFRSDSLIAAMLIILMVSVNAAEVPDWGHNKELRKNGAPRFGLELPRELIAWPALYLVSGVPNSYLFPFFHPESRFVRVDYSPLITDRIDAALFTNKELALRLLTFEKGAAGLIDVATRFGIRLPGEDPWICHHFQSTVDRYVACEAPIGNRAGKDRHTPDIITVDFRGDSLLPAEVLEVTGLSAREPWGRWSDSDEVVVRFARCLPKGDLRIEIEGHAFGPNVGKPVTMTLGRVMATPVFSAETRAVRLTLKNDHDCQMELKFVVPRKTSPLELGLSRDQRTLGLGLSRIVLMTKQSS